MTGVVLATTLKAEYRGYGGLNLFIFQPVFQLCACIPTLVIFTSGSTGFTLISDTFEGSFAVVPLAFMFTGIFFTTFIAMVPLYQEAHSFLNSVKPVEFRTAKNSPIFLA